MRARNPCLQVRSDNEEALKHVLKDACEQVHLEYSNTRVETPASNGRLENSVRAMKGMIQRQKDAVCMLDFVFSVKHPLFALLVRHSEWILNHLVRIDLLVELDNRVIKTSRNESHTGNPAPRSTSLLNRILVGRRDDDDKQPRFQTAWFLGLIGASDEVIALHSDGVQRHHGEWRVRPLDDPESNLRELKSALALMTECDWRTPGCKKCQDLRCHKGWHSAECRERVLPATAPDTMWPVGTTKRLLDTGADDARDDHESKRHKDSQDSARKLAASDDAVPLAQDPSSRSGVKRSNIEAIGRADAEAEKALKRARLLEERRAAKKASARPEEMDTMLVASGAILTETRETVEAPTVSALQQAHEMSHRAETTAESFFQAHKDMTVTSREQARQKQLDFLESMKVYEEVSEDDLPAGTHVMSGRRGYEEPHSDEGCFAATATIQGIRMLLARCLDKCDQGHEAFVADFTQGFLNAEVREGEQLCAQLPEGWNPKTCGVESAQGHAGSSNISETLARTPVEHVERTRFHSR